VSSLAGGILPVLPFVLFLKPFSIVLGGILVLFVIGIIIQVKTEFMGYNTALKQTFKSVLPAILIVSLLSMV